MRTLVLLFISRTINYNNFLGDRIKPTCNKMATNVRVEARRMSSNASKADRDKNINALLRIFKRACDDAGIMAELNDREFFVRNSDKKRRKRDNKARAILEAKENKNKNQNNDF